MTSYQSIETPQDYVNYTFNISSRGITEVAGEMAGLSNTVTTILGQLAFKTSEYLTHTESAMLGLGTAATAAFASSTKEAIKFEQAVANVQAIGGESINAMEIGQAAMRYSSQFGMDVNSMTEGLEALSRAGLTATNVMSGVLAEGVKLSKLEGMDLEDSINDLISTTNLLAENQYDVNSSEYAEAVKAMNQHIVSTSESAPINAQNIIQALQHAGGYVSSAKIDQDDLFAVIAQLGSKGTKGEMAGTALRAFIAAGQKDQAQRALARIGLNVSDLWDAEGNTMLPISEMKQVLDDALEKRGYSQQEKLEFYSDFAGYKQANQIMKIDVNEVQQYKETISQAWDLGKKLETILGTTHNNIQTLFQTVKNFMTRVGSTMLPIINAIIIPIKWGVQLLEAMPFSENIVGMLLAFAGLKAAVLFINRVVPSIATLYTSFTNSEKKAKGIYGHFKNMRKELEQARDILSNIGNKDYLNKVRLKQGLMGRQSYIQHKDITQELYNSVFLKAYPGSSSWKELAPTQKELYYSIAESLKSTDAYQDIMDRFNQSNDEHIGKFSNAIMGLIKEEPESNRDRNKKSNIDRDDSKNNDYIFAVQKNAEKTSKSIDDLNTALEGLHEGTQYDIGKSILSIKEPLAESIGRAVAQSLRTREVIVSDTLGGFQIDGRKAPGAIKQLQEIEAEVSVNLGDIGFFLDYDLGQIDSLMAKVRGDLQQKITAYQNDNPLFMNDTQYRRMEKSISGLAKTQLGTLYSAEQNSIDILDVLKYGKVKKYKKANIGIHEQQMDAIEEALGMDNQSGVERTKRLNNIHKYLRDEHKGTKAQKKDLISEILKTTENLWINTISHDNPGVEASKFLTSDIARYIGRKVGIGGVDWNQTENPAQKLIEYFKGTEKGSRKDRQLKEADRLMFTFLEGEKAQGQIFNAAEAQEIGYLIRRYRQLLEARVKAEELLQNKKKGFGTGWMNSEKGDIGPQEAYRRTIMDGGGFHPDTNLKNFSAQANLLEFMQTAIITAQDAPIRKNWGISYGSEIDINPAYIKDTSEAFFSDTLNTVLHESAHSILQHWERDNDTTSSLYIGDSEAIWRGKNINVIAELEATMAANLAMMKMGIEVEKDQIRQDEELASLYRQMGEPQGLLSFDKINHLAEDMAQNSDFFLGVTSSLMNIPELSSQNTIIDSDTAKETYQKYYQERNNNTPWDKLTEYQQDIYREIEEQTKIIYQTYHQQNNNNIPWSGLAEGQQNLYTEMAQRMMGIYQEDISKSTSLKSKFKERIGFATGPNKGVRYNGETYYTLDDVYINNNLSYSEMQYLEEQLNQLKNQNNSLGTTPLTKFIDDSNFNDDNEIVRNAIGIGWESVDFIDNMKEALSSTFEDIDLSIDNSILEDIKTSVENIYEFLTSEPITTELTTQHNDKEFSGTNNFFIQGDLHFDGNGDIIPESNVVIDLTRSQSIDTPFLDHELSTEELTEVFFAPIIPLVHQVQEEINELNEFAKVFTLYKKGLEVIEDEKLKEITSDLNYIALMIEQKRILKENFKNMIDEFNQLTANVNNVPFISIEEVSKELTYEIEKLIETTLERVKTGKYFESGNYYNAPAEPEKEIIPGNNGRNRYTVPGGSPKDYMPNNLMPKGYPQIVKDQIEENRRNRMEKNDTDLQAQRAAHLKRASDNQKAMNDFLDMRQALFSDLTEKYKKDPDSLTDDELDFIGLNNKRETKRNKKEPTLEDYSKQLNGVLDAPNRKEQGHQNRIQKEIEERNKKAREEVNKKWEETKRLRVFGGVIANDGAVQGPLTRTEAAKASIQRLKERNAAKKQKEAEEAYDKKRNQELIAFVDKNLVTEGTTYIPKGMPTGLEQAQIIKESQEYLTGLANEQVIQFYQEEEKRKKEEHDRIIENENKKLENIENEKNIQNGMLGLNEITQKAEAEIQRERQKNITLERIAIEEIRRKFETGLYILTDEELERAGINLAYSKDANSKGRADALQKQREQEYRNYEQTIGARISGMYQAETIFDANEMYEKSRKDNTKRKEEKRNQIEEAQRIGAQISGMYGVESESDYFWAEQERLEAEATSKVESANRAAEKVRKDKEKRHQKIKQQVENEIKMADGLFTYLEVIDTLATQSAMQDSNSMKQQEAKRRKKVKRDEFWAQQERLEQEAIKDAQNQQESLEIAEQMGPGMLHTMRHQLGVDKVEKEREKQRLEEEAKKYQHIKGVGVGFDGDAEIGSSPGKYKEYMQKYSHISGVNVNADYEGLSDVEKATMKADHRYGKVSPDRKQSWTERAERFGIKLADTKNQFLNAASKVADQYPEEQANEYAEAIGGVKNKVEGALGAMKSFNAGLERAAEVFPPLTIATTALNTAIQVGEGVVWALDMAEMVLGGTELFDTLATWGLVTAEQAEALSKAVATVATWGLNAAIAAFEILISGPVLAAIAIIIAAIAAVYFWERQHADALKKSQEELKETTAKQGVALSQYKDLKKAREAETDAIKKQQAARKEAIALYELEAARLNKRKAVHEEAKARNDAVWGEYGLRASLQKMGLGIIAGGDFESQYENYEGTTKNIRRVKEDTLGNLGATHEQQYVAAFYDANQMAFAEIDAYRDDLGKLYDVESKLIEKYGSIEDARNSQEFADAVQEFCDATGIQAETAVKYLDWLETENKVNQASKVAEANIKMVRARADAKAAGIDMEYGGFDSENMDDVGRAMVYAEVDQMIKDEKHEMWWTMLWEYLQAIISCLFLNFGEASKHTQKALAYQEGITELEENREQYYQEAMDYYENADRYNYGLGSYSIHADTPFGGAISSAATQYAEEEQQKMFNHTGQVMSEDDYNAVQAQYEEETFGVTSEGIKKQKQKEVQEAQQKQKENEAKKADTTLGQLQNNGEQAHRDALDIIDAIKRQPGIVSGLGSGILSLVGLGEEGGILGSKLGKRGLKDVFKWMSGEEGTLTGKIAEYVSPKVKGGFNAIKTEAQVTKGLYSKYGAEGLAMEANYLADSAKGAIKGSRAYSGLSKGFNAIKTEAQVTKGLYSKYGAEGLAMEANYLADSAKGAIKGSKAYSGLKGLAQVGKTTSGELGGIRGIASSVSTEVGGVKGLASSTAHGMKDIFNPKALAGGVDDIAKGLGGSGSLMKGVGKVGGRALAFLGPALAFADKASELNPFEGKHYNEDGTEKKALQATGEVVGTTAGALGGVAGGLAGAEAGAALGATIGSVIPGVGTVIGGALGAVAGGIAGGWLGDTIFQPIGDAIGGTIGWLGDNLLGGVQNVAGTVWDGLTGAAGGVWDAVSGAASGVWDFVSNGGLIGAGINAAAGIWDWLSGGNGENDPYANIEQTTGQKMPEGRAQNQNTIIIKNININTEDDPEKIKSALMNLIIEMQEQINPRQVSRTVGEPPATTAATTDQNENNETTAEGTDSQSGTPNGNSNTNTNTT